MNSCSPEFKDNMLGLCAHLVCTPTDDDVEIDVQQSPILPSASPEPAAPSTATVSSSSDTAAAVNTSIFGGLKVAPNHRYSPVGPNNDTETVQDIGADVGDDRISHWEDAGDDGKHEEAMPTAEPHHGGDHYEDWLVELSKAGDQI